jgi:hypothetical protein
MLPEKYLFSQLSEKRGRVDLPPLRSRNVRSSAFLDNEAADPSWVAAFFAVIHANSNYEDR